MGASSGIGAATARRLAGNGWRVVVNYARSAALADKVVADCQAAGAEAFAFQADVSVDAQCQALARAALERFGRIDALVNNAGTTKAMAHANLDGLSSDDFLRIYATNVVAAFQMTRACAPALKASGAGAVVNVSSGAAFLGTGSSIAYAASKGALNTLTLSLARALGPLIRVNAVMPGYVDTPWMERAYGEGRSRVADQYSAGAALQRVAQP